VICWADGNLVRSLQVVVGLGCLALIGVLGYVGLQIPTPGGDTALILGRLVLLAAALGLAVAVLYRSVSEK
jgi:hypothetical protein